MSQPIQLSQAQSVSTVQIQIHNEHGEQRTILIPAERPLTLYLDKVELVTLMTLGQVPELTALGYLRNQRLVQSLADVVSVQVDWEVEACAITTKQRMASSEQAERLSKRTVTSGCGQGTMFGDWLDELAPLAVPKPLERSTLLKILETIRLQDSVYKQAGTVHGCALFEESKLLMFTEDVGRHNAVDAIAGWMWLHDVAGEGKIFYTTGRLTSEMVMKCAQMRIPVLLTRSGVTEMGLQLARQLGLVLFARCVNQHFLLYHGAEHFRP